MSEPRDGVSYDSRVPDSSEIAYELEDGTVVRFEVDPATGYQPAGLAEDVAGQLSDELRPVLLGARMMFDEVKALSPDEVELEFGAKVGGSTNWVFAKTAVEGTIKVTLTWRNDAGV